MTTYKLQLAYTLGQMPGRESEAKTAVAKLVELYPGFTIETFYEVIRSFNFTEPYMELAADGLRKAGLDIPDELAAGDQKAHQNVLARSVEIAFWPKSVEVRSEPLPLSGALMVLKRECANPTGRDKNVGPDEGSPPFTHRCRPASTAPPAA